jgi:hypothetical protein
MKLITICFCSAFLLCSCTNFSKKRAIQKELIGLWTIVEWSHESDSIINGALWIIDRSACDVPTFKINNRHSRTGYSLSKNSDHFTIRVEGYGSFAGEYNVLFSSEKKPPMDTIIFENKSRKFVLTKLE